MLNLWKLKKKLKENLLLNFFNLQIKTDVNTECS